MKYQKIYNNLIKSAQLNPFSGYADNHHIIPQSMGGSNDPTNLVLLSAKQHFVAHHLLYKIHRNREMTNAFFLMCNVKRGGEKFKITVKQYQILREEKRQCQKDSMTGQPSRAKGKKWSEESKAKLSATNTGHTRGNGGAHFKGKHHTEENKRKISERRKGIGTHFTPHSEETKKMMSENRKGKTKVPWTEERKSARRALLAEKFSQEKSPN